MFTPSFLNERSLFFATFSLLYLFKYIKECQVEFPSNIASGYVGKNRILGLWSTIFYMIKLIQINISYHIHKNVNVETLPLNASIQVQRDLSRIIFYEDMCSKYFSKTKVVPRWFVMAIMVYFISQRIKL